MIPIRDEIKTHRIPIVNYVLILVNVAVFLWAYVFNPNPDAVYSEFALFPSAIREGFDLGDMRDIVTSMFLHAGWFHLLGNMLYLWIFGDNIEDRLGHIRYLLFYLAGGISAAFAHYFINPTSAIPTVGASGAIAAVLGAYLVIYPQSRVYTFIPIGFFARLRLVPAVVVLTLWFVLQLFSGVGSLGMADQGGTAYWAHIGGFVYGLFVGFLFKKSGFAPKPAPPSWN
ncbi:MAG TPA: rhomboid family intramembrane serine protease [Anaerolineaceae bacterium]|nr:rhomboid family intramembrane serine protease [Anaerolineaceae bacterium]